MDPSAKLTTHDLIHAAGAMAEMLYRLPPDEDGGVADHLEAGIFRWMDRAADKLEALYHVTRRMGVEAALLSEEEGRLRKRRTRIEKQQAELKVLARDLLCANRRVTGEGFVTTGRFSARLQRSAPRVVVRSAPPPGPWWEEQDPRLSKNKLRSAIQRGEEIEGVTVESGEHVRFE